MIIQNKKTALIISIFMVLVTFMIVVPELQISYIFAASANELMQQGRIRTCLKPQWNNLPEERGSKKVTRIRLTGKCEAPSGCDCLLNQLPNGAVAADAEGGLDEAFCNETARIDNLENNPKLAKVLGVSTELLAKWAPKPPLSPEEAAIRNKKLRNRCQKAIREANDPVLGAVPVGTRKCNIAKNNLASAGSPKGLNNVLGVTSDGKIPQGNVDIIVEETTYKHSPVNFSAVGNNTPVTTEGSTNLDGAGAGGDKSLKNALLSFLKEETSVAINDIAKDCASLSWDPYGRVFDARSLEPIPDVLVDLIDDTTKSPSVMQFNLPYDVTGDDGLYNIQVEKEGTYSLKVDSLTTHQFVANPKLNSLWSNIYTDLYYPGDVFIETQTAPTHHDIPLEPDGEPYRGAVAKIVPGTLKSEDMNGTIVYTGRTTFPMALTCLINENTNETVGECVNANNIGSFTIVLEKSQVPSVRLRVSVQKVDLTKPELYSQKGQVETLHMNSLMLPETQLPYYFEPILSLVEGYAQDVVGKRISQATVQVKLKINKQLFYQTKADSSGFFTLYASSLPTTEYYLEFIDPKSGQVTPQTTSEFVHVNKVYLDTNKVDLILAQKDNQPVQEQKLENNVTNEQLVPTPQSPVQKQKQNVSKTILMLVGAILLLITFGLGAFILIKRQNQTRF